jgi:hypothetical protein
MMNEDRPMTVDSDLKLRALSRAVLAVMLLISIPCLFFTVKEVLYMFHFSWFVDDRYWAAKVNTPRAILMWTPPYLSGWIIFAGVLARRRWAVKLAFVLAIGLILAGTGIFASALSLIPIGSHPSLLHLAINSRIVIFPPLILAAAVLIHLALSALPASIEDPEPPSAK